MQIYDGQLYGMGTDGKIYHVGTGLPTNGTNALVELPGVVLPTTNTTTLVNIKPVDFFFATLNSSADTADPAAPDTLYATDPSTSYTVGADTRQGVIHKFTATAFDPATGAPTDWTSSGIILVDPVNDKGPITGLTGYSTGTSVVMFATSGAVQRQRRPVRGRVI